MKKIILINLLVSLLVYSNIVFGQADIQVIEIDFLKKQTSNNFRFIDYDKLLKIRIKNLNPFLYSYKITSDGKLIDIGSPNNSFLAGFNQSSTLPTKAEKTPSDIIQDATPSKNSQKDISEGLQSSEKIKIENGKVEVKGKEVKELTLTKDLENLIDNHNKKIDAVNSKDPEVKDLIEQFYLFKYDLDGYINFSNSILNILETEGKSYSEIGKELNNYTYYDKRRVFDNSIFTLNMFNEIYNKIIASNDPDVEKIKDIYSKYNITNLKEEFKKTCKIIDKYNEIRFNPESSLINPNDFDELNIKIEIKKNDNIQFADPKDGETIELPLKVRGGFKFSFSTGLILTSLFDNEYLSISDSIPNSSNSFDKVYKVIKKDIGNFKLFPAAFTHFFWRFGKPINWGLTAGVAYNTNNDQLKYLFGGSLILHNVIGKNVSLMLSGGAIYGSVKVLTPKIQEGNYFKELPTIETVDKNLVKGFCSISFNF